MRKVLRKVILITLIISIALTLASITNYAASGSFGTSITSANLSIGETTSFTISTTNCGGRFSISSSNSSVASVSTSSVWAESGALQETIVITGNSAGTTTITITAADVSSTNPPEEITGSTSISVTVNAPSEPTPEPTPDPEPEPTPEPDPTPDSEPEEPAEETPTSNLSAITIDGTRYEDGARITVNNDQDTVSVYAVGESLYYISVNGISSSNSVRLNEGGNTIVVTDRNGGSITVYVSRLAAEEETPPNVMENTEVTENVVTEEPAEETGLRLETLNIEGLELSPKFDPSVYSYTVNIDMDEQDYSSLNIEAIANDETAIVSIDGNQNLQEGENIINIILTSEDGAEIVTYQLIVNKITSSSEVVGTTTPVDNNNQNMIILIAAVAIVVIIIIVAIILLVRRHKKMNPDYDEYDGYGLYDYDLYNNQNDDNTNNNIDTQNNEDDNVYKFEDSGEENQETNTFNEYNNYNDYDDDFDEGKKKKRRGKGKHA